MSEAYKKLLWLDDIRNPLENDWLVFSPIPLEEIKDIIWVKSYDEFVNHIIKNGLPDAICFDHDLGLPEHFERVSKGLSKRKSKFLKQEEKTGYDCAKWLVDYCIDSNQKLPIYNIQSANPTGKENIDKYLKNYVKIQRS